MYVQNPVHGAEKVFSVREIKASASALDKADTVVILQGKLTERINHDSFWFNDETGKIKIELEDHVLQDFKFDPSQSVIITGEVDHDLLEGTEIEVAQLEIVNQ